MLATQIRPKTLDEVVGQDTIVKTLKSDFKNGTLSNVLFFIGSSGSGKNTFANIVATTLSCDHPTKDKEGVLQPCLTCPSCKDIIEERFQKNVTVYNGSDVTADAIRELEKNLQFATFDGKPKIIIINEAQLVKELRRLLEIIETNRNDVYFIFTSTDKSKFSNISGKDNKTQETKALRSRGSFFNIKSISTDVIKDYLFTLVEKFDPDGKIPDTFLEEGLQVVAENSYGNIRQAINDFHQCIKSEAYTVEAVRDLLGYEDEKEFHAMLYGMALGKTDVFEKLEDMDIQSFFHYTWTILTSTGVRNVIGKPCAESWKEKTAKALIDTGNLSKLLKVYEETYTICAGYFNDKVFYTHLIKYYSTLKPTEAKDVVIKKIKKIKE